MCVSATRNGKEVQPSSIQNKFDLVGSHFANFLLAGSFILVTLLVNNLGVVQTNESTKSKTLPEESTMKVGKKETTESFVLLAHLVGESNQ